jgi:hypothetical protein
MHRFARQGQRSRQFRLETQNMGPSSSTRILIAKGILPIVQFLASKRNSFLTSINELLGAFLEVHLLATHVA